MKNSFLLVLISLIHIYIIHTAINRIYMSFTYSKGPFTNYVIGIWGGGGQSKYYRELMGGRGGPPKKL